jgi:DNA-binding PadR family transcriptional regulator
MKKAQRDSKRTKGSTSSALLGLLSIRPMSGYDIRQLIPESIGHFWSESYGQIYPALKQMKAAGLVERRTERQKSRPDRHVYSLTRDGRRKLTEWLRVPPEAEVPRSELLLKLFFGAHAPQGVSREHVAAFRAMQESMLRSYAATAKQLKRDAPADPNLPYWLITLNMGQHRSKALVKWAKETLRELERLESKV